MSKIFADLFANAKTFDGAGTTPGISRVIRSELEALRDLLGNPDYPTALDGSDNEVQVVAQYDTNPAAPATYILTFNLRGGVSFSTAAIAFDAAAATVQTAVDTAASGVVSGYANGHIAVTGSALSAGNLTITFSGASVSGQGHTLSVIALTVPILATTKESTTVVGDVGVDEVQHIIAYANDATGGTFTLTLTVNAQPAFTTAPIAHNANAATVETAIDVAATAAAIPGWVNGDITVSGGPLASGDLILTFDGTNVDETDQGQTTINGALLTNSVVYLDSPSVTTTSEGSTTRPALAVLVACGIIGGTLPAQGDEASGISDAEGFKLGPNPNRLSVETIKALALQAAIEDSRDELYGELLAIVGIEQ